LWVLACSTIVEYSQQEGFYRVPLPVARLTPNLEAITSVNAITEKGRSFY